VTDWGPDLFTLDKTSSVPIYVQLAERISTLVTVGTLVAGDKLPSIRSVAEALRVDYNTVAKAYTELDRAGIIHTARGIGTHVTGETDEAALAEARHANLHSTLQAVIGELVELGYTYDEIETAFRDSLSRNG
jgi:GntR family transcriptional regulator